MRYGLLPGAALCALSLLPACVADDPEGTTASTAALATAPPVKPNGGCSSFPPTPCGEVQNNTSHTAFVSLNWTCSATTAPIGSSCPKSITSVSPGHHIGGGSVDVDAFEVLDGCTVQGDIDGSNFTRGPGWYKFSSLNTVTLHTMTCSGGGGGCLITPCVNDPSSD